MPLRRNWSFRSASICQRYTQSSRAPPHIDNGSQLDRTGAQTNPLYKQRERAIAMGCVGRACWNSAFLQLVKLSACAQTQTAIRNLLIRCHSVMNLFSPNLTNAIWARKLPRAPHIQANSPTSGLQPQPRRHVARI